MLGWDSDGPKDLIYQRALDARYMSDLANPGGDCHSQRATEDDAKRRLRQA